MELCRQQQTPISLRLWHQMNSPLIERANELLERVQAQHNESKERMLNIERQLQSFTSRLQAAEGNVALMRAHVMEVVEQMRKMSGGGPPEEGEAN